MNVQISGTGDSRCKVTSSVELFRAPFHINSSFPSQSVLGTTREKTARNVVVHFLLLPSEISCPSSRVNGRMGFIVLFAPSWCREFAILEPMERYHCEDNGHREVVNHLPRRKLAPFWRLNLLLNESLEIELRVKLVGFGTGVGEKPLLI